MANKEFLADQAYKIPVCNRDIRRDVLLGEHKGIRRQQSSIHILRTTNTRAYASDCTREEIRRHRLSCTNHVTSVCIRWQGVLVREDEWVAVLAVGSSGATALCAVTDSATDREGIQPGLKRVYISDHLL
jgi:uncharacterized protein involved in tolerance to divalent cations